MIGISQKIAKETLGCHYFRRDLRPNDRSRMPDGVTQRNISKTGGDPEPRPGLKLKELNKGP
jgi:hypothetical protein